MDQQNRSIQAAIVMMLVLTAMPSTALAQSDLSLRDYIHTEWTQYDGMPLREIRSMAQSADGWLWLSTSDGVLLRFDGMRFAVERELPCTERVREVRASREGIVWLVCGSHFVRRTPEGRFEAVTGAAAPGPFGKFRIDANGRTWSFDQTLRYVDPVTGNDVERTIPSQLRIWLAIQDSGGAFWASDGARVFRIREGEVEQLPLARVQCMAPARAGGVLASVDNQVWHLDKTTLRRIAIAPSTISFTVNDGCMSDQGSDGIWIGTRQHGVARIINGRIETFSDRTNQRQVIGVLIDRTETVWVQTSSGLHRFRKPMVQVVSKDLPFQQVPYFAFADSNDAIWAAPVQQNRVLRTAAGGEQQFVQSKAGPFMAVGEDGMGRVWLSDRRDIGYVVNGQFVATRDSQGASILDVRAFAQDEKGRLWALANGTGVYQVTPGPPRLVIKAADAGHRFLVSERFGTWIALRDRGVAQHIGGSVNTFRNPNDRPSLTGPNSSGKVQTIVEVGDSIWIGTASGVRRWRRGEWTDWSSDHGLPDDGYVQEIAADQFASLWMMTRGGLLVLPRAQFDATTDGQPQQLTFAQIGPLDGVVPHEAMMATWPRVARDRKGRLLFTTIDSIVRVDPARASEFSFAPSVVIDTVTVDTLPVTHGSSRRFVEPSLLQFEYTALDLPNPEHGRFRYRLEGHDADWTEAGGRRSVTYGSLPPGRYQFTVIATGSTGMWSKVGATFTFEVAPVFWRAWWFRVATLACASLVVAGVYRLRMRQVSRSLQMRFEERLAERSRVARDLHDTLLQTVQGSKLVLDGAIKASNQDAETRRAMEQVSVWLSQASKEGRDAVDALRTATIEGNNLSDAFSRAVEECRQRSSLQPTLSVIGEYRPMHAHVCDDVYLIGYEAIRNACAHSGGSRVAVEITYARDLTVRVVDNGSGVDPDFIKTGRPGHFGLQIMKERAERIGATFNIMSEGDIGTTVTLSVPGRLIFRSSSDTGVGRIRKKLSL